MPQDSVFIEGLKVDAVIGVCNWERIITQPLVIDLELFTDIRPAAESDNVEDAINYKQVCDDVTLWCQHTKAQLLEHLAETLAQRIIKKFGCAKLTIKIAKPTAINEANAVGVKITRYANE